MKKAVRNWCVPKHKSGVFCVPKTRAVSQTTRLSFVRTRNSGDRVDPAGESYVDIRDPASVVRRQGDLRVTPAECDVGVMVGRLGKGPDLVDERECLRKVWEGKAFFEDLLLCGPAVEGF